MRIIGILIAIYLSGCSALGPDPKRILIQEYNQGSLYLKYFHPNRPVWDKISDIGSCYIENDLSFIDIDTVKKELKLKLSETLQLQYGLNVKLQKLKKFYKIDYIDQKEEEKIFYELTDKVSSGILFFNPPSYKRISLIWVDPFYFPKGAKKVFKNSELKNIFTREDVLSGHPVLISFCLSTDELENIVRSNNLQNVDPFVLGNEITTPRKDELGAIRPRENIFLLNSIFINKEVNLFVPRNSNIEGAFEGDFKVRSI